MEVFLLCCIGMFAGINSQEYMFVLYWNVCRHQQSGVYVCVVYWNVCRHQQPVVYVCVVLECLQASMARSTCFS